MGAAPPQEIDGVVGGAVWRRLEATAFIGIDLY